MRPGGNRLGIDFGTSSTVAVLAGPDGRHRQLLFGETPVMPSAVCLDPTGALVVGGDAVRLSRARPEYFEPNPKARIDDGAILLGDAEVPIVDLIGAVLRRVHDEAVRTAGGPLDATVLTHPAGWAARRRGLLAQAAATAGLPDISLVAEPVAAAAYFVQTLGTSVPIGSSVVVYDLGAGTFDASVVRRTEAGYAVLAEQGILDAGGLDLDAAIFAYLGAVHGAAHPELWQRLAYPRTAADRRSARMLWDDVRTGKESLSRASVTTVFLPVFDTDATLGREQLELLARPLLDRTVAATRNTIRQSGVPEQDIAAVFLVGGASRMPLAATLLHRALRFAPTAIEQPQLVVAGGSLHVPAAQRTTEPPAPPADRPATAPGRAPVAAFGAAAAPISGGPAAPVSASPAAPVSGGPAVPVSAVPAAPVSPGLPVAPVSVPPVAPVSPSGPRPPVETPRLAGAAQVPAPPVLRPSPGAADRDALDAPANPSRRRAVSAAAGVGVLAAIGGIVYVATLDKGGSPSGSGDKTPGDESTAETGGPETTNGETPADDEQTPPGVKLASASQIPEGGGKIISDHYVVITQPESGTFKAFTVVCTHQGCNVSEVSGEKIRCSCHGSKFSIADGSVISGPATEPLAEKTIHVLGDDIWVEP
jgi:Rieske Fe-S protein/Ethanolamine utilization protein EutJ (predicted chaperonin)